MTRRAIYISSGGGAAILLCALWWWSGGSPVGSGLVPSSARAASRPATSPTTMSGLLPEEYSVLISRNPFGGRGRGGGGPEASLVFKGVILSGVDYLAFFEDAASKNVTRIKVGGKVARGRIKSMDLDGLVYETADGSRRIAVGQNLNGETPPPPPPPATQNAGPPGPSGPPAAAAARGRRGGPQPQPGPPQPMPIQLDGGD